MIIVLADDISGAAEVAGAALRHGLSAEVQVRFDPTSDADVICVDADTRSRHPTEAAHVFAQLTRAASAARLGWIYKKCDSVLRGSVAAETRAMLAALKLSRAYVISANPSRGRVIRGGHYYINEQALHETLFARDPEYPRTTSNVRTLLGGNLDSLYVPDVCSSADVEQYAAEIDFETLPVGGVDFFAELLRRRSARGTLHVASARVASKPALLVCGSAASWTARREQAHARGVPEFEMPHDPSSIVATLASTGTAMVGIGDNVFTRGGVPADLAQRLAATIADVVRIAEPAQLLLEGGATAVAVIRALGWTRLRASEASPAGVGVLTPLHPARIRVLVKPGSYPWPEEYWPPRA